MNAAVLNLEDASVEEISQHVKTYGSMSIPEMLFIDKKLRIASGNNFNLTLLLNNLIEEAGIETPNGQLLRKMTNNFELYCAILYGAI